MVPRDERRHRRSVGSKVVRAALGVAAALSAALLVSSDTAPFPQTAAAHETYTASKKLEVRARVTELFYHGYNSYMRHAFPKDELKPLSCKGDDTFGGYSLTLIDTLDMLALVGDNDEFMRQVHFVGENVRYHDRVVSVFETTIRVLGGLISAHHLALRVCEQVRSDPAAWAAMGEKEKRLYTYSGGLLTKAVELADLMLPAFDTPTGIPFNEINMQKGTQKSKGHTTCPAGAGSLLLEFGALSVLTGNCTYVTVAERALEGVWKHRSGQSLVGTMIDVFSGKWINGESSIGASIDSFYEYMVKSYMYFGEDKFLAMWDEAYKAVQKYTYFGGWYLTSTVDLLAPIDNVDHKFNSLQAFWPGLQVLAGDVHNALESWGKMWCVVEQTGLPPEYVDLASLLTGQPQAKRTSGPGYPLRPEFLESTYFLYKATGEERFLNISESFIDKLAKTRQKCGFAAVVDVYAFTFEDKMDSFVLAETFKYLYLLFTPTREEVTIENAVRRDSKRRRLRKEVGGAAAESAVDKYPSLDSEQPIEYPPPLLYTLDDDNYVVNTEAHPLPIDSDSQDIFRKCDYFRRNYLMKQNVRSKIAPGYRAFRTVDATLGDRNEWDLSGMCRPVDYMRDVAPFIAKAFYNEGYCAAPPSTRTLGHAKTTYQPAMSYDVILPKIGAAGVANRGGSVGRVRTAQFQTSIAVPPDPLVIGSKLLKLMVSSHVAAPMGQTPTAPTSVSHFGVHSIPLVTDVDTLFLPSNNLFIRKAPIVLNSRLRRRSSSSDAGGDETDASTKAAEAVADANSAAVPEGADASYTRYRATDVYVQCTNANFGPQLCEQMKPLNPNVLKIIQTVNVYRAQVHSNGCTPDAIGDTSLFARPFAIAIDRGGCTFKEKALSAQIVGAAFAVIVNSDDQLIHMGDSAVDGDVFANVELAIGLAMLSQVDEAHVLPPRIFAFNSDEQLEIAAATTITKEEEEETSAAPSSTQINVVCARNAVEQYRLMGLSMLVRANDVLIFRHRMAALVDAYVAKTQPLSMRRHYTDPLVDCPKCILAIHEGPAVDPVDTANYRPSTGLYGGAFLELEPPNGGDAAAVSNKRLRRRLQFALAARRPSATRYPLITDANTSATTGVAYFFGDSDENMRVVEVRRFRLTDPFAFYFYNNRLGTWLEKKGAEIGVGGCFVSFYDSEKKSAVEVTLYSSREAMAAMGSTDFETAAFSQGQAYRHMRDLFITDLTVDVYDGGREHFVMPDL